MDAYTMIVALSTLSMGFYWYATKDKESPSERIGEEMGEIDYPNYPYRICNTCKRCYLPSEHGGSKCEKCSPPTHNLSVPKVSSQEYQDAWYKLGVFPDVHTISYTSLKRGSNELEVRLDCKYYGSINQDCHHDIYWYAKQNKLID